MTLFKRTLRCTNCNSESAFSVDSELEISEVSLSGKCKCGSTMQITYGIIDKMTMPSTPLPVKDQESSFIADNIFDQMVPNNALKDLIED